MEFKATLNRSDDLWRGDATPPDTSAPPRFLRARCPSAHPLPLGLDRVVEHRLALHVVGQLADAAAHLELGLAARLDDGAARRAARTWR